MKISIFMNLFYSKKIPKKMMETTVEGVIIGILFAGLYHVERVLNIYVLEIDVSYLV